MNVGILGAGSWGIALSVLLERRGHTVRMWEFSERDAHMLKTTREHRVKLPGIIIPEAIQITNDINEVVSQSDHLLCVVPSQTMRATMRLIVKSVSQSAIDAVQGWIIASKGIEVGSLSLMTEVILQEIPGIKLDKILVLSGPSHAEEVSRHIPTAVVAASPNYALATRVQNEFSNETFRIYTNNDVVGVELSASVKNVIAIAAGICDGLGFGDNTKGAILTRGMVEMIRLGRKMGADEQTFTGLAGIGDLITTCISRHSRNRNVGEMIGSGMTIEQALGNLTMVAEGVETTKSVYQLSQRHGIEMPITTEVYRTLFEGKSAKHAARDLMIREWKPERW